MNNQNNNTPRTSNDLNGHAPAADAVIPPVAPSIIAPKAGDVPVNLDKTATRDAASAIMPSLLRRLSAQRRAPGQSERGMADQHDPLTRRRDTQGNPLPRVEAFLAPPAADDKPLETTPMRGALEVIAAQAPGRAAWLHHFYNHRVQPALTRLNDVVRDEWELVAKSNAEIERHNVALTARQADLDGDRDEATLPDRQAIEALGKPIGEAHRDAAEKVSLAGGSYDPSNPSPDCVLRHKPLDLRAIAGRDGLPHHEDNVHVKLSQTMALALSGLVGTMVGVSVGIIGGVLHAARLADELPQLAGCALLGSGAALAGGRWVKGLFYESAQMRAMGKPASSWVPAFALGTAAGASIIVIEAVVEQQGLLKLSALQNAFGGSGAGGAIFFAVGMLFGLPYIGAYAYSGWAEGTNAGTRNRLEGIRETEFRAQDDKVRALPVVQTALDAIARVNELGREKSALETRVEATAAPFNAEIAACEADKREPRHELDTPARHRIQDAYDNWNGAQLLFDRQFEEALHGAEPAQGGGFWQRLLRAIFGVRPPKGRTREGSHRA